MGKVYFLSDLHLGARSLENPVAVERRVVDFLKSIERDADELYLVGDVIDYWYEYRHVVPRGYVRFFGQLARMADAGVKITWLKGNHDIWIFDYLPKELGIEVVDGPITRIIDGKQFYISHGDEIEGADSRSYRALRRVFRNRFCQRLFAGIHPRWTVAFALAWSRSSRCADDPSNQIKPDKLEAFARHYLDEGHDISYFIFGHLHIDCDKAISDSCRLIVLGEWMHACTYAVFDGTSLSLLHYQTD